MLELILMGQNTKLSQWNLCKIMVTLRELFLLL